MSKNGIDFDEPEKLALRVFLINEYHDGDISLDDINDESYDYYGAPIFTYSSEEYVVIPDDMIESVFHDYAEDLIDECILCDLPERYQRYFDDEKFIRDMSFDGYGQMSSYDGNDNEIQLENGEYYHILRWN